MLSALKFQNEQKLF